MKLSTLNKRIEKNNEIFNRMSNAKKRVVIAKDVLDRIAIGQLKSYCGAIVQDVKLYKGRDIKDALNNDSDFTCSVCAKGAMLMGYVGRVNQMKFDNIVNSNYGDSKVHQKLAEIFTLEQLALIELAFEGVQYLNSNVENFITADDEDIIINAEDTKAGLAFYNKYKTSDYKLYELNNRLIAICKNIIENKGTFKP
jgi:hypothetical protein